MNENGCISLYYIMNPEQFRRAMEASFMKQKALRLCGLVGKFDTIGGKSSFGESPGRPENMGMLTEASLR